MSTLDRDIDSLKAVGHGALSLVNAAIVLAIVAVILSTQAQTAQAITAIFSFLSWLVGAVITPLQQVSPIVLTNQWQPAASVGSGGGAGSIAGGLAGGLGGIIAPPGGNAPLTGGGVGGNPVSGAPVLSSSYAPGLTYGAITNPDGTVSYGYGAPSLFQ